MRKLAGLVVILVVLILGGYYVTGMVTERTLRKDVNMINQSNGLHVEIKRYDRGWFTSHAELDWRLHIPERMEKDQDGQSKIVPSQDYTLDMPLVVYHGPVIFSKDGVHFGLGYAKTNLNLPEPYMQQLSSNFASDSTLPRLEASVLVNYLNRSRFRIELPEFTLISKEGNGRFEWQGLTSNVTVNSRLDRISGDLTIDGIQITKEEMKAVAGKVTSEYDLHQTKEGLYLGDAAWSFPSLVVNANGQKVFELSSLNIHISSDVDDGLFQSELKMSVEEIFANKKNYGPGELNTSIKNLDAAVLAHLNEQASQLQQGSEQERQQASFALLLEVPKLFNKGAEFEISKLSFNLPEGKIDGQLALSLPKSDSSNPFQLIQKIEGEGRLKLPEAVVKDALKESAKQQLMQQPTLTEALTQQIQSNNKTNAEQPTAATQADDAQAAVTSQTTLAELDKKADVRAQENLQSLIGSGALKKQGEEYTIHLKLSNGQLSVNGQPFNSGMLTF